MSKYGLIGKNIDYSFSRAYFADKFANESIQSRYVNFDCASSEEVAEILKDDTVSGYNVTIPYKLDVLKHLSQLSTAAQDIGAVNTIKRTPHGLKGYNTDYLGFITALEEQAFWQNERRAVNGHVPITKALILGTGGASRAVQYALENRGVEVQYVSRKRKENSITYQDIEAETLDTHKLIVNCTPLGTYPEVDRYPEIPYELLTPSHILYDLVYNPTETVFLQKGKAQKSHILNGARMLELQAEASYRIWTLS